MWGKVSFPRSRKPSSSVSSTPNEKALPAHPPNLSTSSFHSGHMDSDRRVASSIYSRDITLNSLRQRSLSATNQFPSGPVKSDSFTDRPLYLHESGGISPPDSPVFGGRDSHSGRVSPLEEESTQRFSGQMGNKFMSHLPVPRKRAQTSHADGLQSNYNRPDTSPGGRNTSWGSFSGEPGQVAPEVAPQTNRGGTFQINTSSNAKSHGSSILGWGKELAAKRKLSEARSRFSKNDNTDILPPSGREPWKGASGRSPIVPPIQEKPRARSSSRARSPPSNGHAAFGNFPSVVTTITGGESNIKVPEKHPARSRNIPTPPVAEEPASTTSTPYSLHSRAPPRVDLPPPEPDFDATTLGNLKLTNDAEAGQPTSRFSATTYEPTEAGSSTRTVSPRNSIEATSTSTENVASIMSRKRPVTSTVAPVPGRKPVRKPTPSEASVSDAASKDLPQCPPEQNAHNRIEMMEARRDTLVRRKTNINTIIHELTQVIQPSSVAYDMAAREEVKKTVASLNTELADIQKEEHEIGVKLYRAMKKRDENDYYGGSTSLWVKRVTS